MTGYLVQKRGLVTHLPPVTISVLAIAVLFLEIPCHSLSLPAARNWTEETWIQSCKTSSFDHSNHSFKRVNAEPVTFEDWGLLWTQPI